MKKGFFVLSILLSFYQFVLAGDEVRIQGKIMEMDVRKSQMTVNERRVDWNNRTLFMDEKGSPVTLEKQGGKRWVYVIGERDPIQKRIVAERIYFIPKFVGEKEKSLYSFME